MIYRPELFIVTVLVKEKNLYSMSNLEKKSFLHEIFDMIYQKSNEIGSLHSIIYELP